MEIRCILSITAVVVALALVQIRASAQAEHGDHWICDEASIIEIDSNRYRVCGVGTHEVEEGARALAAETAFMEFERFCERNSRCRGQELEYKPLRTTCTQKGDHYKCFRGFDVQILDQRKPDLVLSSKQRLTSLEQQLQNKTRELAALREENERRLELEQVEQQIALGGKQNQEVDDGKLTKNWTGDFDGFVTQKKGTLGLQISAIFEFKNALGFTLGPQFVLQSKTAPAWSFAESTWNSPADKPANNQTELTILNIGVGAEAGFRWKVLGPIYVNPVFRFGMHIGGGSTDPWSDTRYRSTLYHSDVAAGGNLLIDISPRVRLKVGAQINSSSSGTMGRRNLYFIGISFNHFD